MGKTADTIENNRNVILSTNSTIASIGLAKAGQKVAGVLVTPAVWVLNYSATGGTPDKVDGGLYAMGFFGALASGAAVVTGLVKAVVDDDIDTKLRVVQTSEGSEAGPHVKPCYRYGMMAPQINATTIASKGGTAWKHPNGLWVYITDARGLLIHNYKPKSTVMTYRPDEPLRKGSNGGFAWSVYR